MKRFLLVIVFITLLFLLSGKLKAQNQTVSNGAVTTAVTFPGAGCVYNWTNDNPSIGLAASGTGNIPSFTAVNIGSVPVTATIRATSVGSTMLAYITNNISNNISVISIANNAVVATIATDSNPWGVAASVDGSRVYIANSGANTVSVINASTNTILTKIPVQNDPGGIAITPDGKLVYVVNSGSNTISVINTATNTVIANVSDPSGPWCVVVSPDGSTVYVTDIHSNKVEVINTATNTIVNTITVGKNPYYLSISADGKNLYVANSGENSISLINTISKAVSTITVAASPQVVCLSPDGSRLYVQHLRSPLIEIINTADNTILSSITMPSNVLGMSVSSDGNWLYAANGNIVSALNVSNYSLITIPVGTDAVAVGNFISAGPGCSGTSVTFSITVNPSPTITYAGILPVLTTIYGNPSPSASFTVAGTTLLVGILVTAPTGFEVSTDNVSFNKTVTIGTAGNTTATPVYIRLAATTAVGVYSGNVVLSSTGAGNINVATANSSVTPAPLTITVDNKNRPFDVDNPVLTVTYSGFVNNEGLAQLTVKPTITTTAAKSSAAGQYPITASGAMAPNYYFIYIPGILTIQSGIIIPNTFTPNGDGINDTWDIKNIDGYPNSKVEIFNRNGERVFYSINYPIPWNGRYGGSDLPAGTYYYVISLNNNSKPISGWVAVIR